MFLIGLSILLFLFVIYICCFIAYEREVGAKLTRKNMVDRPGKRVWSDNEWVTGLCEQDVRYDDSEIKLEYVSIKK